MLTYSIPAYRLPKAVVRAQVSALESMGIRFELGASVGGDGLTLQDLRARHQSVFLATGLWNGKKLRLERGELLDSGLEFLINVQRGVPNAVGERVLVIGGGSVAVDVAITARRLGARQVTMACLESLDTMPAIPEDIEQAHEEGITILPSWGPHRVVERDGKLVGMELVRCTVRLRQGWALCAGLRSGRSRRSSRRTRCWLPSARPRTSPTPGPALRTERGMIVADEETAPRAWTACSPAATSPAVAATVVQAMAAGQQAAAAIDAYLVGARLAGRDRRRRARYG